MLIEQFKKEKLKSVYLLILEFALGLMLLTAPNPIDP